jgi:hypothetical protein
MEEPTGQEAVPRESSDESTSETSQLTVQREASAESTSQTPPMSFTLFPKLPLEIRHIIWELFFVPRIIHITHVFKSGTSREHDEVSPCGAMASAMSAKNILMDHVGLTSKIHPVIPLSICRDSRAFSLSRGFTTWRFRVPPLHNTQTIMWNPVVDFISIQGCPMCSVSPITMLLLYPEQTAKIQNLVLYTQKGLETCLETLRWAGNVLATDRTLFHGSRIDVTSF